MLPFLIRLSFVVVAIFGGIVCVSLSLTSRPAAYVAMACYGVAAVSAIVLIARRTQQDLRTPRPTTSTRPAEETERA